MKINCLSNVGCSRLSNVLILLFSTFLLTTTNAINNQVSSAPSWKTKQPWEYHSDPNPCPSIAELETSLQPQDIDQVLNRLVGTHGGIIIQRFFSSPKWLWRQWFGTVLCNAWPRALINMAWALAFCIFSRYQTHSDFKFWTLMDEVTAKSHPFIARLALADKIWATLMNLATFLLTFFIGQAYSFWNSFINNARKIQGRLNDILLLLTSHAAHSSQTGVYTEEALIFLQDTAKQLRLFHLLHWASHARRFNILLTRQGWDRMVERDLLTETERKRLDHLDIPATHKHYAILQSLIVKSQIAISNEKIMGIRTKSLERMLLTEFTKLRGICGTVPDMVDCRMPLAYTHFVQILVDSFLVCTPIAKYDDLGIFCVLMIGILTFFYHGLLILAKVFLDPLDNEDYCEGCTYLDLAVLIRESNAASQRWINGAVVL